MREFGLSPSEFWRLGVAEWRWLAVDAAARGAPAPMSAKELEDLMRCYPDRNQ